MIPNEVVCRGKEFSIPHCCNDSNKCDMGVNMNLLDCYVPFNSDQTTGWKTMEEREKCVGELLNLM